MELCDVPFGLNDYIPTDNIQNLANISCDLTAVSVAKGTAHTAGTHQLTDRRLGWPCEQ